MNTGSERLSGKDLEPGYTALLQRILMDLIARKGYRTGSEIDLRIDPNWRPGPDVLAALRIEQPYPTKPDDILVIEILSPDDRMVSVLQKCRHYVRVGIPQIFVFDPEARDVWQWDRTTNNLERIQELPFENGSTLPVDTIWAELDSQLTSSCGYWPLAAKIDVGPQAKPSMSFLKNSSGKPAVPPPAETLETEREA